jgi:hypothetical protein
MVFVANVPALTRTCRKRHATTNTYKQLFSMLDKKIGEACIFIWNMEHACG